MGQFVYTRSGVTFTVHSQITFTCTFTCTSFTVRQYYSIHSDRDRLYDVMMYIFVYVVQCTIIEHSITHNKHCANLILQNVLINK